MNQPVLRPVPVLIDQGGAEFQRAHAAKVAALVARCEAHSGQPALFDLSALVP